MSRPTQHPASNTNARHRLEEKRAAEVAHPNEPILLGSMRRHPEGTVEVHWGATKAGTSARGFVAEFEEAIEQARAEGAAEVVARVEGALNKPGPHGPHCALRDAANAACSCWRADIAAALRTMP